MVSIVLQLVCVLAETTLFSKVIIFDLLLCLMDFIMVQMFRYGGVREIWFDGAKDPKAQNMSYYFSDWFSMVKELQSSINVFSDAGPDVRWVGNERGFAGKTCWSTINRSSLSIGSANITQ